MSPKFVPLDSYMPVALLGINNTICNVKQIFNVNKNLKHFINRYCCQKIPSLVTRIFYFLHSIKAEVFEILVLRKYFTSDSKPPL